MVLIDQEGVQPDSHQCGWGDAVVPRIGFAAALQVGREEYMNGGQEQRSVGYKQWFQRGEKCLWSLESCEGLEKIHPRLSGASSSIHPSLTTLFT